MPVTITPAGTATLVTNEVLDSDCDATAENDVRSGAATVFYVFIDNTANTAISYFKAWNNAAPTVGTTAPDMVLPCPASARITYWFGGEGMATFATALSIACVTTAGTAGTTSPTNDVTVRIGTN